MKRMQARLSLQLSFVIVCSIYFTACAASRKPAVSVAAAPSPPVAPDPPTVIATQSTADLPDPQPIPPEAIPRRDLPNPAPVTAGIPAPRAPSRRATTAAANARAHDAPPVETPPDEPATAAGTRPPLNPVDPNAASVDKIQKRIDAVRDMSNRIDRKQLPEEGQMTNSRIKYFLDLAVKALARKDLRQADSLASRAQVLAEDLLGVR